MSRYKYQELFSSIGDKTKNLRNKSVMIIGVGGLGSVVADMLNREGIGLRIVDKGRIELSDLQRQSLYLEEDDAKFKAKLIKKRLEDIESKNKVRTFHEELVDDNVFLLDSADVIVDCSNNLKTMNLIADYVKKKTPLINCKYAGSKAAIFISDKKHLFRKAAEKIKVGEIEKDGVINAVIHTAAGIIVAQTLKTLIGEKITDNLICLDVWNDQIRRVSI